jgi:hypothetical protein
MHSKLTTNVNEFVQNGNLTKYESELREIFTDIDICGCKISARYDPDTRSSHSVDESGNCRIQISLKKGVHSNELDIIWIILHEFGHHFAPIKSEHKNVIDEIIMSEERAWDWAEKKIMTFDSLSAEFKSFTACKIRYLNTYYKLKERSLNE